MNYSNDKMQYSSVRTPHHTHHTTTHTHTSTHT